MKERLNNTLQEVELLMKGKIKALRFYKVHYSEDCWLDDEQVLDATNYLDGKCIFYTLKDIKDEKYGEGLELKLINDVEEIDCLYEDLNCRIVLDGLNKDEERFLNKLDKMKEKITHVKKSLSVIPNKAGKNEKAMKIIISKLENEKEKLLTRISNTDISIKEKDKRLTNYEKILKQKDELIAKYENELKTKSCNYSELEEIDSDEIEIRDFDIINIEKVDDW